MLLDEFQKTLEILVAGSFLGMKHAAAHMKQQASGSIINMASTAGLSGFGLTPTQQQNTQSLDYKKYSSRAMPVWN